MRKFLLAVAIAAVSMPAFAADPAPPAATPQPQTVPVQMTVVDAQVALIAVSNAGAACDAGVTAICQILMVRDGTVAKLRAAVIALQQPAPASPAKK